MTGFPFRPGYITKYDNYLFSHSLFVFNPLGLNGNFVLKDWKEVFLFSLFKSTTFSVLIFITNKFHHFPSS